MATSDAGEARPLLGGGQLLESCCCPPWARLGAGDCMATPRVELQAAFPGGGRLLAKGPSPSRASQEHASAPALLTPDGALEELHFAVRLSCQHCHDTHTSSVAISTRHASAAFTAIPAARTPMHASKPEKHPWWRRVAQAAPGAGGGRTCDRLRRQQAPAPSAIGRVRQILHAQQGACL